MPPTDAVSSVYSRVCSFRLRLPFQHVCRRLSDRVRVFLHSRSGAAAVEFALVLPAILLLVFGAAYLGIYIGLAHSLQQLSADASRYAMVGLDRDERRTLAGDAITRAAEAYPMIEADRLSYRVEEADRWLTVRIAYDVSASALPPIVSRSIGRIDSLERSATVMLP
ncbi:TadE/TadG family type IV pilus assembly protein [Fulvimarina sp. 2208YS6-2-32]|uniref:TadE/TadG family type IV pilus assembly protein n=1 Tax=Fulvimarina uroteuthidis TaxID=3098149 RepID=A0ABU5I4A7_9HYPH|nr:TadE/TadG family type IV pilus assembly protein [Fulvimarina sp. 2208YS6-2-32]MDY8110210.1 TadE/TadG family type IV pilus assembly protein [Fulvimarina sp. 2208YS6-2-32]